jgi:hypothetical protein
MQAKKSSLSSLESASDVIPRILSYQMHDIKANKP